MSYLGKSRTQIGDAQTSSEAGNASRFIDLKKQDCIESDSCWPECKYLYCVGIIADAVEV